MALKVPKTNRTLAQALGQGYRVGPHIDRHLEDNPEQEWKFEFEPKIGDDAFHPSGDCTPSVYELWQKANGVSKYGSISASLRKTFMMGHYVHAWLQTTLTQMGWCTPAHVERRGGHHWGATKVVDTFRCPSEAGWCLWPAAGGGFLKPAPFHWATGSADIAPLNLPSGNSVVLDIKTMHARDFASANPPAWTVDKWECQLAVYMEWHDLDEGIILGFCKDSPHGFKEFTFERNPELVDAIMEKWNIVSYCLDNDIEPPEDEDVHLPLKGPRA